MLSCALRPKACSTCLALVHAAQRATKQCCNMLRAADFQGADQQLHHTLPSAQPGTAPGRYYAACMRLARVAAAQAALLLACQLDTLATSPTDCPGVTAFRPAAAEGRRRRRAGGRQAAGRQAAGRQSWTSGCVCDHGRPGAAACGGPGRSRQQTLYSKLRARALHNLLHARTSRRSSVCSRQNRQIYTQADRLTSRCMLYD